MRRAVVSALLAALVPTLAACGGDAERRPTAPPAARAPAPPTTLDTAPTAARPAGDPVARVVRPTTLHARPAGRVVARLTRRTEFGSPRHLPVVRRRGGWLAVVATQRPNGRLGWIRAADARLSRAPHRAVVDLSKRELRVLESERTVLRMRVGIGAPATPTPTGRFALTDAIVPTAGSPYGCCALALSGHQPNVPQGWAGGDRLAVHGTDEPSSIGGAASHGCLRASDRDLRRLMRVIELGSLVVIRR